VDNLADTGCEIYEMVGTPMPVEPLKPLPQEFDSEEDYKKAETNYETSLELYKLESERIDTMVAQGTAQLLVDVSQRTPQLCYRVVSESESVSGKKDEVDTIEKLRKQDARNKEIAFERGLDDTRKLVRAGTFPNTELQEFETKMLFYCMLGFLRKENYAAFGFDTEALPTDDEKFAVVASLTDEQKHIIQRDFIIKHLSDTSGIRQQSHLLMEFAKLYFPKEVKKIQNTHVENYTKKHLSIEARILAIQPTGSVKAIEAAKTDEAATTTEEPVAVIVSQTEDCMGTFSEVIDIDHEEVNEGDTFHEPEEVSIVVYPGIPQHVRIGEVSEEEEHLQPIDEMREVCEMAA